MAAHPDRRFSVTTVPTYIEGSRWRRLTTNISGMLCATWLVLNRRVDILHVHLAHGGSVVRKSLPLAAARLVGVPSVIHAHSYDFGGWFDRLKPIVRAAVRRLLVADYWLVLGGRHVEEYASRLQLTSDRIGILHNAVRVPATPVSQFDVPWVHAVALGRLGVRKGSYDLIAAVAELDDSVRSQLRVTLAGDGEVDQVRAAIAAAELHETIHAAGWLDPAARDELLCSAHIFVLPSHDEGLPMALLEAMAHGLAPVTTMVGSIGEAVEDGVNGVLVAPGSPGEIAEALAALVDDEALRTALADAARSRAQDFSLDRWYERLTLLWTDLASTPPSSTNRVGQPVLFDPASASPSEPK
jgi:glycosyltransferase involved in cell wall biosynthesis